MTVQKEDPRNPRIATAAEDQTHPASIRIEARLRTPRVGDGHWGYDDRSPPPQSGLPRRRDARHTEEQFAVAAGDVVGRGEADAERRKKERRRSRIGAIGRNQGQIVGRRYSRDSHRRHRHHGRKTEGVSEINGRTRRGNVRKSVPVHGRQ